jgi:hypothetical protein
MFTITATHSYNIYLLKTHVTDTVNTDLSENIKAYNVAVNIYRSSRHPTLEAEAYRPIYNILLLDRWLILTCTRLLHYEFTHTHRP